MNYNINTGKNDLMYNSDLFKDICNSKITVINDSCYDFILFNNLNNKNKIKKIISNELLYYFNKLKVNKGNHILIVGIGNDNYTADSIGPRVLKHLNINAYLDTMGYGLEDTKVSALEPGVLGETGILTATTIKSVVKEIKPDLVILVDSLITDNVDYINKCIEITDIGLSSSNGISQLEFDINEKTLGIPVILIGVVSAILVSFNNDSGNRQYLLSTKDVDKYVNDISFLIGDSINKAVRSLK